MGEKYLPRQNETYSGLLRPTPDKISCLSENAKAFVSFFFGIGPTPDSRKGLRVKRKDISAFSI